MGRMGQDYQYPIDAWLQDLEMELSNAGEHKKRVEFCRRILEMLDWSFDDASNFKSAIGEELYAEGKVEQGEKAELYNDLYDDFAQPIQQPNVKEKKVYPNGPCPCGSGKKYKKCCGRKK